MPETLETKALGNGEIAEAFDDFMHAFEAFKETNDQRLSELERRLSSDVITQEKLERVNLVLDEQKQLLDNLVVKSARPHLGRGGSDCGLYQHQPPGDDGRVVHLGCRRASRLSAARHCAPTGKRESGDDPGTWRAHRPARCHRRQWPGLQALPKRGF